MGLRIKVGNFFEDILVVASWFSRVRAPKPKSEVGDKLQVPGGLWTKCPSCHAILYREQLENNMLVCPKCAYHFRLTASQRIEFLVDSQSFDEFETELKTSDPLSFRDSQKYKDRLKKSQKKTGDFDAVKVGHARFGGVAAILGVLNFDFMGGSMGMVVGEKLTRAIESAVAEKCPMIIVSSSGGARMQEGIYSLMQMAKVTAALNKLAERELPYISLLTDPTTGGVAASFAMLGDINIAEPGALIGFAGPRVIEQTIRRKLPEGFQRAEFLLKHGMVDLVVPRFELNTVIGKILGHFKRN